MKRLVLALAGALPLMTGVASAATAISSADAEGLVGESGAVETTTASLSQVSVAGVASAGETSSTLFKSLSAAQSSTVTSGGATPISAPTPSPIPEPGAWAMMLIGAGAVGATIRTTRRRELAELPIDPPKSVLSQTSA